MKWQPAVLAVAGFLLILGLIAFVGLSSGSSPVRNAATSRPSQLTSSTAQPLASRAVPISPATTAPPAATFTPYVGEWRTHDVVLRINTDKTGTLTFSTGPCPAHPGQMCAGVAHLRFATTAQDVAGKITATSVTDAPDGIFVGNTAVLQIDPQSGTLMFVLYGAGEDNHNYCKAGKWIPACGA